MKTYFAFISSPSYWNTVMMSDFQVLLKNYFSS